MHAPSPERSHLHIAGIENEMPDQHNPLVPQLKSPRASEIARAVIDCAPLIPRSEIARRMKELGSPEYLVQAILSCGEVIPGGDPHEQFFKSLGALVAIDYLRKVYGIDDDFLTKASGQESANIVHFGEAAGVEVTP